MNKELEKVCEEKFKNEFHRFYREDLSAAENQYKNVAQLGFESGFKAAIESDQVKDHIVKNDKKVKDLVDTLGMVAHVGMANPYDSIVKKALEDWESKK